MDHPQFDHREIYEPNSYDTHDYDPNGYDPNDYNYNETGYGGTQFLLDSKLYFLLIGVMIYTSCFCLRSRSRIRDTDLITNINQNDNSKVISKIKKNIVSLEDIDKSSTCSICLEEFNSEKEIAFLDCKHIYHMECIIEWITKDASCPLCRGNQSV